MKNNEKYDFLNQLAEPDDAELEEISELCNPLDNSSKSRITALCKEKMAMKNDDFYENDNFEQDAEVIKKISWYKRPSFTIAASAVIITAVVGGSLFGLKRFGVSDEIQTPEAVTTIVTTQLHTSISSTSIKNSTTGTAAAKTTVSAASTTTSETIDTIVAESVTSAGVVEITTVSDETEIPDEIQPQYTPEEPIEIPTQNETENYEILDSDAYEFMDAYYKAASLESCAAGISFDLKTIISHDSFNYCVLVTDSDFQSADDIRNYLHHYMTDSFIEKYFSSLTDDEDPIYFNAAEDEDPQQRLFCKYRRRTDSLVWCKDTVPVVEKLSDDSYTVSAEYYAITGRKILKMKLVRDNDGLFRIDSSESVF